MIKSQSKNKIPFLNALFLKSGFQISRVFIANEKSTIFAHIEKKKKTKTRKQMKRVYFQDYVSRLKRGRRKRDYKGLRQFSSEVAQSAA